jgi:hypothetical protein
MGVTPVDLYRAGNSTGPRMDHVRRNRDIAVIQQNGVDWVNPQQGGVSTRERIYWPAPHWWRILQNTSFTDLLVVRKDHSGHWVWEPSQGMEFAEYVRLLATLNGEFIHV